MRFSCLRVLPFLLFGLFLTGCDSNDEDSSQTLEGTWALAESDQPATDAFFVPGYFELTTNTLTEYHTRYGVDTDESENCIQYDIEHDLVEKDGDRYTYETDFEDGKITNLVFDLNGDNLSVTDDSHDDVDHDPVSYERTDIDFSSMRSCE